MNALQLRHKFLVECGSEGGSRQEFKEWLMQHLPELNKIMPNENSLRVEMAASIWRNKTKPDNPNQIELVFIGHNLPYILRLGESGDSRSVLCEYANVQQFIMYCAMKQRKVSESVNALKRTQELVDVAMARCGGDLFTSLRDIQDGMEGVA